jgi:hypothetical protein
MLLVLTLSCWDGLSIVWDGDTGTEMASTTQNFDSDSDEPLELTVHQQLRFVASSVLVLMFARAKTVLVISYFRLPCIFV